MSIEIDWELSDAPAGDDDNGPARRPSPNLVQPTPSAGEPPPAMAAPQRRWWLVIPLALLIVAAFGIHYVSQLGWQRISDEIVALVRYEEQLALQGETLLVLRVQDYTNSQWLEVRGAQVAANQPAPLPIPVLSPEDAATEIGPVELIEPEWVRAEVFRHYTTPDGQLVNFTLPQFYRRQGSDANWVRTAVPDSYWGTWEDWRSPHLFVRHSARDQALVEKIAPRLEALLAEACALWGETCVDLPPAKLFFSGFVGSLAYDPLANVRVRVEFGDSAANGGLPADYFVSVPSPQMAGVPADTATEQYLTDYLAVRLIASLADTATANAFDAEALTVAAVNQLNLLDADPGFVAAASDRPLGHDGIQSNAGTETVSLAAAPGAGSGLVTSLKPAAPLVTYQVQAGDTLLAIAFNHNVSVNSLVSLNRITDPDVIREGTFLLIPPVEAEQVGPQP